MDRISRRRAAVVAAASALVLLPGLTQAADPTDTKSSFGFNAPVAQSATGTSTAPGDQAVTVADGLSVKLVSDKVGLAADQLTYYPDANNPTTLLFCNEVEEGDYENAPSFQRLDLATGEVTDMLTGLDDCDLSRLTPWGTILAGEEIENEGLLVEILDPLSISGVAIDKDEMTTSDPDHVRIVSALGQLAWEGAVILADGTTYYGEDRRPGAGSPGGGIYKFVPEKAFSGSAAITSFDDSPYTAGSVYGLRVGTHSGYTDWGRGRNIGAGVWIPVANDPGAGDGAFDVAALSAGWITSYYRTEDFARDPIAAADSKVRFCFPNTGSDADQNYGEVVCLEDAPADDAAKWPSGAKPVTSLFVVGDPELRMPDNIDFQPGTGIMYLNMDATTSTEEGFTNDDIWACLPDSDDHDLLTDGCVRVATLLDGEAEFTGIAFKGDGKSFLQVLQHRTQDGRATPNTTDIIEVSGFSMP